MSKRAERRCSALLVSAAAPAARLRQLPRGDLARRAARLPARAPLRLPPAAATFAPNLIRTGEFSLFSG